MGKGLNSMREFHFLLLAFLLLVLGCGKDHHDHEPPSPPSPPPPKVEPVPEPQPPQSGWPKWPFPMPGIPGIPTLPGLPSFPLPGIPGIPGSPGPQPPSNTPSPAPSPYPGDVYSLGAHINEARASRGLSPVMILPALNCAAKRHADDIGVKRVCGHYGSDGSSPWDRARDCGTSANGEIVACGQGDAKGAVDAWTLSPGHAAIMYDPGQRLMGVAMLGNYWVAIFQK